MQTESIAAAENPYTPPTVESGNSLRHSMRLLWHALLIVVLGNSAYSHLATGYSVGNLNRLQGVVPACGALVVGLLLSTLVNPGERIRNRAIGLIALLGMLTIGNLSYFLVSYRPSTVFPINGLFDYFVVIADNTYPGVYAYLLSVFVLVSGRGPISVVLKCFRRLSHWVRYEMMDPNSFP